MGNRVEQPKLGILHHFDGKRLERCHMIKIGQSKSFWTTLVGKDWEKCEIIKIRLSESFQITLVGKIGKSVK